MRDRRTRARASALLGALGLGAAVATACGDYATSGPSQGGDSFFDDTRDSSTRATPNPDDGAAANGQPDGYASGQPDAPYGEGGSAYGSDAPSVYPGVAECASCSCPSTKAYCFGGATPRGEPMIRVQAGSADAGPPCPMVPAGSLGCTALPAGATNCSDLNAVLQPSYSCYLVCAFNGKTMSVYCPSP